MPSEDNRSGGQPEQIGDFKQKSRGLDQILAESKRTLVVSEQLLRETAHLIKEA